ncbi:uncharacterized protein L3040_008386 [Drepanopeziza brunnea f. sp. 'multigermtubi']|uniref:Secreted protein n=1 Tax=Marssonina brunnea f. sp. multigermtubi (strain MB_m1) TaxID=1072389 RepID=K1WN18_MARBU|nr:uncharacterized protein MBM_07496 [Drepanopeziza brunnea f. sp. 'multigermtubi' MB_m1]EKD14266.1 hypothetical protein MBM_07496 [Drepanopeziza brunnea f. sp. 'multigermtubi' MB_m1]KAJ5035126.1 hypothetical protein L3040_008386 [Drepanopeziza brunnea f. sp. 'multigermtubi']
MAGPRNSSRLSFMAVMAMTKCLSAGFEDAICGSIRAAVLIGNTPGRAGRRARHLGGLKSRAGIQRRCWMDLRPRSRVVFTLTYPSQLPFCVGNGWCYEGII